jgi:hypothetical protein
VCASAESSASSVGAAESCVFCRILRDELTPVEQASVLSAALVMPMSPAAG